MRSRLLTLKDPASVDLSAYRKPFVLDRERLDRELRRAVNPYIRWEKGDRAARGDLATCRLESDCPRFQKDSVKFAVGSGMFNPRLEALAEGMVLGETRELDLPEGHVALTLLEVTNKVVPELTDDLVEKLGLEGVHTVEEYTAYLTGQQMAELVRRESYAPTIYLIRQVVDGSEFVLYQEDWQKIIDLRLERSRVLARAEDMTLEEMTPEQFEGRIPVKSYHELVAMEQRDAWQTLCLNLLGRHLAAQTGQAPSQEGYDREIRDYVASWSVSEELAQSAYPYECYAMFFYNLLAHDALERVVRKTCFEEEQ